MKDKLKRRDICIYIGEDSFGLEHGELVEVLGMDDNKRNIIFFYGEYYGKQLIMSRGTLPKNLMYIDHISQLLNISALEDKNK